MVHAALLSRRRYRAGPSGAANPAVRRYPTRAILPVAPGAPSDGYADMGYPLFMAAGGQTAVAL